MIYRYEYGNVRWIDIEQPTPEDIRTIAKEFGITSRIETELLSPTPLPVVAADDRHVLLVLHVPEGFTEHDGLIEQEVDFVVGKNIVITVRYEVVTPMHRLQKLLEATDFAGEHMAISTEIFLEIIFAHLFESIRNHTNHIAGQLGPVEREIFGGHEREAIGKLSRITREFVRLQAMVANHEDPLNQFFKLLERRGIFHASFAERATRIRAGHAELSRIVATHRSLASELRQTNDSLISTKQNEVMRTLAVITAVLMPAELIIFIFDMQVPGTPLENNPYAFWNIIGTIVVTVSILMVVFARKRWL